MVAMFLDCLEAQTRGARPEWRSRIELAISLAVTQCPQWVKMRNTQPAQF
jgi:hypothetical protein